MQVTSQITSQSTTKNIRLLALLSGILGLLIFNIFIHYFNFKKMAHQTWVREQLSESAFFLTLQPAQQMISFSEKGSL
jgi:hypothetical protein